MRYLSRVMWSEGMYLSPQHFQAQSRYFEDSLWFLHGSLRSYPWGLLSFMLDADAVRNGSAAVRTASGVFPDGLAFDVSEGDEPPPPLNLRDHFETTEKELLLSLSVPGRSYGTPNVAATGVNASSSRYGAVERMLRDETISEDEYPVMLGCKNLRLTTTVEYRSTDISMPVARILRDGKGGFVADSSFLPPLLRIGAVEDLLRRLKRLADTIEEKITVTRRGQKVSGRFEAGSSALDVANYWFLHALCSALPALRSRLATRSAHPEDLYSLLAELGGSLCTFSLESSPDNLAVYDHLRLNDVFDQLEQHIYAHLEVVVPSNTVTLEFHRTQQYVHVAPVNDERCFRRSRWILGIRSNLPESALLRLVPSLIKVCSGEGVVKLVQRALQGLELVHLPVPPSALAAQVDMQYFSFGQAGPCWQHILATRQVGVYLPGELQNAVFEVTVITEAEV